MEPERNTSHHGGRIRGPLEQARPSRPQPARPGASVESRVSAPPDGRNIPGSSRRGRTPARVTDGEIFGGVKMIGSKQFAEGLEGLEGLMELISRCWGSGAHFTPDMEGLRALMDELEAVAVDPEFTPDVSFETGNGEVILRWRGSWTRGRWLEYVYYQDGSGKLAACTGTGEKSKFFGAQDFLRTNLPEICRIVGPVEIDAAELAGETWMEAVLTECDEPDEWLVMDYQEFLQAAANANRPAFPSFESGEELDAAYDAAWDQLASAKGAGNPR